VKAADEAGDKRFLYNTALPADSAGSFPSFSFISHTLRALVSFDQSFILLYIYIIPLTSNAVPLRACAFLDTSTGPRVVAYIIRTYPIKSRLSLLSTMEEDWATLRDLHEKNETAASKNTGVDNNTTASENIGVDNTTTAPMNTGADNTTTASEQTVKAELP
jgi:hypothetical protein